MNILLQDGLTLAIERVVDSATGAVTWSAAIARFGGQAHCHGFATRADAWRWLQFKAMPMQ